MMAKRKATLRHLWGAKRVFAVGGGLNSAGWMLTAILLSMAAGGCAEDRDKPKGVCGNGVCEPDETAESCFGDCGCGNGTLNEGEECDGYELGDATCESLGYDGGGLFCTSECTYDTSSCQGSPCGNGLLDPGESCDGSHLGGQSCADLGFTGGTLSCALDCTYDTSACTGGAAVCGNGVLEGDEECDDGNTLPGDGCDGSCRIETVETSVVLLIPESGDDRIGMFDPQDGTYLADFLPANQPSDPWQFSTPVNAIEGPQGHVFVSDQIEDTIYEFDGGGSFVGVFAGTDVGLDNVRGMAFKDEDLHVCLGSGAVAVFDDAGNRLADYIDDGSEPFDIAFLDDGRMAMSNLSDPDDVRLYAAGGASFESLYSVDFPEQIVVTDTDTLVVACFITNKIVELDTSGSVLAEVELDGVRGVYPLGNGNWLATASSSGVVEIDPTSGPIGNPKQDGNGWRFIEAVSVHSSLLP
jgi:cysteine-rich repeat protein